MQEVEMANSKSSVLVAGIVAAVIGTVMAAAILGLFSTQRDQGEAIARMEGAGHPFTDAEAREMRTNISDIRATLARIEGRLDIDGS
jgi:hypothetical protein